MGNLDPAAEARIAAAAEWWLRVKDEQQAKSQAAGRAQGGTRGSITGGKHLDGFERLILDEIESMGVAGLESRRNKRARLPGFYRASKDWDLLILQDEAPVLAIEFKSQSGSVGNNANNRLDEVLGVAEDAREAEARGILPANLRRAYIYVMELTQDSTHPVRVDQMIGTPDPAFVGRSYMERVAIACNRLRDTGLYHLTWALGVVRDPLSIQEPDEAVGWAVFSAELRSAFAGGEASIPPIP